MAFFAFKSDVAFVNFDGLASDGQAEASTTPFPRSCLIDPEKTVEDMWLVFAWDSRSLVDYI